MTGQPDEAGRFAESLRDLKDRTGHSYGVLAGRLHIGRSTLHRYCLGETVPSDYAVVERLARLAGASREELIELHRRWVLADEARARAAAPRPPAADGTAPGSADGTAPGSADGTAPGSADGAAESASSAPRAPAAGPRAEAPGPRAAAAGPRLPEAAPQNGREAGPQDRDTGRETARPTGPKAAPRAGANGRDVPPGPSAAGPGGPEAPRGAALVTRRPAAPRPGPAGDGRSASGASTRAPRQGRRRRILTAGTAAALTVGAVIAANVASDTDGWSVDRPGPVTSPPLAATGPAGPAGPAMSADADIWNSGCDHRYLVDREPGIVPSPPVQQDAAAWADSLGAVDGGRTTVQATVSAPANGSAVVQRLSVRVVDRRPALDWRVYAMSPGCGGKVTPARYAVDLDVPRPLARPESGGTVDDDTGEPRTLPAPHLPFRVTRDDPLVLRVEATAVRCDCDWYLEAEWTSGDRSGTLRIDDGGRPFRTSGTGAEKEYYYAIERDGWTSF